MIKKFENFDSGENLDPELEEELRFIYEMLVKAFDGGDIYNFSYRYGGGHKLVKLARKTDDTRIRTILASIADYCQEQHSSGGEDLSDYVEESDLDDLGEFLGEPPIDWSQMSGLVEAWMDDDYDDDYDYDDEDSDEENED